MKLLILSIALIQYTVSMPQSTSGTTNTEGPLSGNNLGNAINAPSNTCGVNLNVLGIGNSASGNNCKNPSEDSDSDATSGGSS